MDEQGLSGPWLAAIYGSLSVLCAVAVVKGIMVESDTWLVTGLIGLVVTMSLFPIAMKRSPSSSGSINHESLHEIRAQVRGVAQAIERMQESSVLSDDARRVLNRSRERELLRRAIEEDIETEDWDAAIVLIRELAERFGYRADAEEFRTKVETARFTTIDRHVGDAIRGLESLIASHRWDEAMIEAERIGRVYPDSPKAEGLRHRVQSARERFKMDLERRFLHAAQEDRIDEAMDLLKELDHYLDEHEAEHFREVARGVIGKARENLGVQFKLALQDKAWGRAVDIGEEIIADFPNTRMADEVRGMIDKLRERASMVSR